MIDNRQKWLTHFAPLFYRYFYDHLIDIDIDMDIDTFQNYRIFKNDHIDIDIAIFKSVNFSYQTLLLPA